MRVRCIKTMDRENEHPFVKGYEYDIDQPTAERLIKEGYLSGVTIDTKALDEAIQKETIKK